MLDTSATPFCVARPGGPVTVAVPDEPLQARGPSGPTDDTLACQALEGVHAAGVIVGGVTAHGKADGGRVRELTLCLGVEG